MDVFNSPFFWVFKVLKAIGFNAHILWYLK